MTLIESPKIQTHYWLCSFKLHIFFSRTFPNLDVNRAFIILSLCQEIMFQYWQLVSMLLNACFCHDLMQTLRNPFEVARNRMCKYITFSIGAPMLMLAFIWTVGVTAGQ